MKTEGAGQGMAFHMGHETVLPSFSGCLRLLEQDDKYRFPTDGGPNPVATTT